MPKKVNRFTYDELSVGQTTGFEFSISKKVIADFARISGDRNPLHSEPKYARMTEFKKPIAHGMIAGALFSRLVGMELPGEYSLYLSQTLKFHLPMFPGQRVCVQGEVLQKIDALKIVIIHTLVRNKKTGELMVDGQGMVRVLK